jgi:hypothetical protein
VTRARPDRPEADPPPWRAYQRKPPDWPDVGEEPVAPPAPVPPAAARAGRTVTPRAAGFTRQVGREPEPRRVVLADRRGLTVPGAVIAASVLTLLGTVVDATSASPGDATLRNLFTICFVAAGAIGVVLVHRERAMRVVIALPILYAVAALVGGEIYASRWGGTAVKTAVLDAVTSMVTHAPTLLVLVVGGGLLAGLRRGAARRASRRPASRYRPG